MGIQDRDYMKRRPDGDGDSSLESKAEEFAQRVLGKSRKLLLIGGIVVGLMIIIALIVSRFSGASH